MEYELWLGSEASYNALSKYLAQYQFDKEAFLPSPFNMDQEETDPDFGVSADRIGLTLLKKVNGKAVIEVRGSLVATFSRWHAWFPGSSTSYEAIRDALDIAAEAGVTDVLMNIDSNGGVTRGIGPTVEAMKKFIAAGNNLEAHTDGVMASAAYWLGSAAKKVTASEMAEVGSIGVMAVLRTLVNTEEKMGVKFTVLKSGKNKALGNPFEELTPEIKAKLQKNIDETNAFFLNHVSRERNLMVSEADVWADGNVFYAKEAMRNGLIDQVSEIDTHFEGGSAAANQSDTRRAEMKISPEKLAQIQAGAKPEEVLTQSELVAYKAMLETQDDAADPEANANTETETGKNEPADDPSGTTAQSFSDELRKALVESGKLEAKLEAKGAEIAALQGKLEGVQADLNGLLVVAQVAISNMQVALNLPKEAKGSVTEVLAQHTELQGRMAKVFGTGGQKSTEANTEDTTGNVVKLVKANPRFADIPKAR